MDSMNLVFLVFITILFKCGSSTELLEELELDSNSQATRNDGRTFKLSPELGEKRAGARMFNWNPNANEKYSSGDKTSSWSWVLNDKRGGGRIFNPYLIDFNGRMLEWNFDLNEKRSDGKIFNYAYERQQNREKIRGIDPQKLALSLNFYSNKALNLLDGYPKPWQSEKRAGARPFPVEPIFI